MEGAREALRGATRQAPARAVRGGRHPRRAPRGRGRRACTSTTRRTGSPTRRSSCSWRSPSSRGSRTGSRRCSPASGSTSPRTGRSSTSRCACRRSASLIVDGVDVVKQVHEVLDRMAAFSDRVRSGEWRGHTGPADPQRDQHRDRRVRPRPGDGLRGAAPLLRPRDDLPVRLERRLDRHRRGDP